MGEHWGSDGEKREKTTEINGVVKRLVARIQVMRIQYVNKGRQKIIEKIKRHERHDRGRCNGCI